MNVASLLSLAAVISTQFSMMSCSENEAVNVWSLYDVFVKKNWPFYGQFGHKSEMDLYNILSTLEKFECWNRTVLIRKYQADEPESGVWSSMRIRETTNHFSLALLPFARMIWKLAYIHRRCTILFM